MSAVDEADFSNVKIGHFKRPYEQVPKNFIVCRQEFYESISLLIVTQSDFQYEHNMTAFNSPENARYSFCKAMITTKNQLSERSINTCIYNFPGLEGVYLSMPISNLSDFDVSGQLSLKTTDIFFFG